MKLAPPQIPPVRGLEPTEAQDFVHEASFERAHVVSLDLSGIRAGNLSFDEAVFEKVQLTQAQLEKIAMNDCIFKNCDLSGVRATEGSWIRIHSLTGRMVGMDCSRSTLKDVVFEGCKLNMTNFRFAKLVRVHFIDCALAEVDFQSAELTDVTFEGCHMEKTAFDHCRAVRVDMRKSELIAIRGWQSLKGATIDLLQLATVAPQLAAELGLTVV